MSSFWNKAAGVAILLFLFSLRAAYGGPMVIKMATLAPEGSSWHRVLLEMGKEWETVSGGTVVLRIYPGGVVGDEDAMLRKMRVGQLQAAAITGMGLAFLDRSFYGLHVPMMFSSDEEFRYVRNRLSPLLEKRLEEKGFLVLNWGDAGWVHFFAREAFTRPSEMKEMKLYIGAGDVPLTQLYKEAGFRPVPISVVDILPGLQTGLIDAFNATPLAALAFQWFALAPHMADLKWAPLTGATIIDKRAWEKIPEGIRPKILEISRDASERLHREIRNLNEEAMKAMIENGLKITHVSSSVEAEWRKMVEDIYPQVRGKIIPADVFDAVRKYRDEFRSSAGPARALTR
ncbi:MAG TPA: TRAP transporter substrate-binding protein DctP [Candidatus Deferrimicrobiaceae bacterium]|nr:TRAP transporter substrate-binding protein DctP [Candidatus Deferrimicrobiaceae bacterium]